MMEESPEAVYSRKLVIVSSHDLILLAPPTPSSLGLQAGAHGYLDFFFKVIKRHEYGYKSQTYIYGYAATGTVTFAQELEFMPYRVHGRDRVSLNSAGSYYHLYHYNA